MFLTGVSFPELRPQFPSRQQCVWFSAVVFPQPARPRQLRVSSSFFSSQKLGRDLQYKGRPLHNTFFLSSSAAKCVRAKAEESPCSGNVMQSFQCFQGERLIALPGCIFHCISSNAFQLLKWASFASTSLTLPTHGIKEQM